MREYGFVSVQWSGKALTPEEQWVLVKVAALWLRGDRKRPSVSFTHELIDGRLTHQSSGVFVTFVGNFFRVDLGEVDEQPWFHEFLILKGMEDWILDSGAEIFYLDADTDARVVDPKLTRVTSASLLS